MKHLIAPPALIILALAGTVSAQTAAPPTVAAPALAQAATTSNEATALAETAKNTAPDAEEIAALRTLYVNLQAREAAAKSLLEAATPQTLGALEAARSRIAELEEVQPLEDWKTNTLAYYEAAMQDRSLVLPQGLQAGLQLDPVAAQVPAQTVIYGSTNLSAGEALMTTQGPTPVLRVADTGPVTLVWTPDTGFGFAVTKFVEVYE